MKEVLSAEALTLLSLLNRAGYEAYVVGGCVRDFLMGKLPHDIDVTTSATPAQMKQVFSHQKIVETGIRHGTLSIWIDSSRFEVTTFRTDGVYLDNRHPRDVSFTQSLKEDLSRRDFTVNAMAYHPNVGLVDYFGGRDDVKNGSIRAVGEPRKRFEEDGLRILRALRFASRLGFTVEEKTAKALHDARLLLKNISKERIFDEMTRLLCGADVMRILAEYVDVIGVFLPELLPTVGFTQNNPYHIYDVFCHTVCTVAAASPDPIVRWAALLHDLGKVSTHTRDEKGDHFKGHSEVGFGLAKEIMTRLRADKCTVKRVSFLVEQHDNNVFRDETSIKRLLSQCSAEDAYRLLDLQKADSAAHAPAAQNRFGSFVDIEKRLSAVVQSDPCVTRERLALLGEDVVALGVPRGKEVGKVLEALLDAVIDGRCENTPEGLTAYIYRYLSKN